MSTIITYTLLLLIMPICIYLSPICNDDTTKNNIEKENEKDDIIASGSIDGRIVYLRSMDQQEL